MVLRGLISDSPVASGTINTKRHLVRLFIGKNELKQHRFPQRILEIENYTEIGGEPGCLLEKLFSGVQYEGRFVTTDRKVFSSKSFE